MIDSEIYNREPLREDNGVKVFSNDDFYWFYNISKEALGQLNKFLEDGEDLLSICRKLNLPSEYLSNYYRSDFIYFLPYKNNSNFKVLDLGAGFGNITIPLAQKMPSAKIYAVDGSLDILRTLAVRAKKTGCLNIEFIKTDIFENKNLPFKEKSFDVILMNGVLEWIGSGTKVGNPRIHQLEFLKYIKSLLKDGGVLYIGIESRFFPGYFKDVKDPHSKLLFTSIVPRLVADLICRFHGRSEGYRNYIYSFLGYKKLLKEAGFPLEALEIIYPVVSYKDPIFYFSYLDKIAYKYAFTHLLKKMFGTKRNTFIYKILYKFGLEKLFAASCLFLANNRQLLSKQNSLLNYYLSEFLPTGLQDHQPLKVFSNLNDDAYVGFWLINKNTGEPEFSFKIKRFVSGNNFLKDHFDVIKTFNIKEFLLPDKYNNLCQFRSFWPGKILSPDKNSLKLAINLIKPIHKKLVKNQFKLLSGLVIDVGFVHGDYTLDNILFNGKEYKIIDFEDCLMEDFQIFDIVNLLLHYYQFYDLSDHKDNWPLKMLMEESLSYFKMYSAEITIADIREILKLYCNKQQEKFIKINQRKFDFYRGLMEFWQT